MSGDLAVLVVDDDFRVASVHEGFVARVDGFAPVGVAHTAAEAIEAVHRLQPDVVLLDLYLPDGSGFDVLRSTLELERPPVVLVISAATDADSVARAHRLGAVHFVMKPFGFAEFAARLAEIPARRAAFERWPANPTQADIDAAFGRGGDGDPVVERLSPTLALVYRSIRDAPGAVSATSVAQRTGLSRATAQRYLAQLEQTGLLRLELQYGRTGRPEHRFTLVRR